MTTTVYITCCIGMTMIVSVRQRERNNENIVFECTKTKYILYHDHIELVKSLVGVGMRNHYKDSVMVRLDVSCIF